MPHTTYALGRCGFGKALDPTPAEARAAEASPAPIESRAAETTPAPVESRAEDTTPAPIEVIVTQKAGFEDEHTEAVCRAASAILHDGENVTELIVS